MESGFLKDGDSQVSISKKGRKPSQREYATKQTEHEVVYRILATECEQLNGYDEITLFSQNGANTVIM